MTLQKAISEFGKEVKSKLSNPVASGAPEDQLRAPLEELVVRLAELTGLNPSDIVMVGETSLAHLKTRPDFAVTHRNALIGFIEVKSPGKGADPRRFQDRHDKEQWDKLRSLPNLMYTDGNEFSLWRDGVPVGEVVRLKGDVRESGAKLNAPDSLLSRFSDFLQWEPQPPSSAAQLAVLTARLCRLLRSEVEEQLAQGSSPLTNLATDWRKLLFPSADDEAFADGYAQAVTFGLLMARARHIPLSNGLHQVAVELRKTNTLIGSALRLLTDDADNEEALKTSLATLCRVLDAVRWPTISKGDPEAWLYFYEMFLKTYDNELRKKTGSYYTPPQVVEPMVKLVDEALRSSQRFALSEGLASDEVTVADPAIGTGTFLLGVLRRIAQTTEADQGPGAVPGVINAAASRLIGFELQFGPFAVAQLRLLAELRELIGDPNAAMALRLFVTDTLGNPYIEDEYLPNILKPIGESRRQANEIKRQEKIVVVIGNPPYKEKAKGLGGWIENGSNSDGDNAPLLRWMPPLDWNVSNHAKHLRNLYVYFWRWATWKVFGDGVPSLVDGRRLDRKGLVFFITVAGFLNGPGFQGMRSDLRSQADEIWVIDCSPEGLRPNVSTRIFEDVKQPVCMVMAVRSSDEGSPSPAKTRYRVLPKGPRKDKFSALEAISLDDNGWTNCPSDLRAPFLPAPTGPWAHFSSIEDLFLYNGSGVMPGRTWVIAPDRKSLGRRWDTLLMEDDEEKKQELFHPHPQDRHIRKVVKKGLYGHNFRRKPIALEDADVTPPVRYAFRSFDRQWIIPDNRAINRANPNLWNNHSSHQVYMTASQAHSISNGPSITFSAEIPDMDHYNNRGGRVFPLWSDPSHTGPNIKPSLLRTISESIGSNVDAPNFMAYLAGIAAHPAFTKRFQSDLVTPGLRIPLTANLALFEKVLEIGREVIWLHTFGERFFDPDAGRPHGPPRMPDGQQPYIPKEGAIPNDPDRFPDHIEYVETKRRLHIGEGFIENVLEAAWTYEVSGMRILPQWFSYRRLDRSRPLYGDRREPSPLSSVQPKSWPSEYTTDLMNVLHVLGRLVLLEPRQAELLERVCDGPLLSTEDLHSLGAFHDSGSTPIPSDDPQRAGLFAESNE